MGIPQQSPIIVFQTVYLRRVLSSVKYTPNGNKSFRLSMGTVLSSAKYTPDGRVLLPLLLVILLLGVPYHRLNDFHGLKRLDGGEYGILYKGYHVTRITRRRQ